MWDRWTVLDDGWANIFTYTCTVLISRPFLCFFFRQKVHISNLKYNPFCWYSNWVHWPWFRPWKFASINRIWSNFTIGQCITIALLNKSLLLIRIWNSGILHKKSVVWNLFGLVNYKCEFGFSGCINMDYIGWDFWLWPLKEIYRYGHFTGTKKSLW